MTIKKFLLTILFCLASAVTVFAQEESLDITADSVSQTPANDMVWDEDCSNLFYLASGGIVRFSLDDENYTGTVYTEKISVIGKTGSAAAISEDMKTVYIYAPGTDKVSLMVKPGFTILGMSVSDDGSMLCVYSADKIRTVIYNTETGRKLYDLKGFETAAPVYDSFLSPDNTLLIWHSRGTFAIQNIEDGTFGEYIRLWDFASSYEMSPDNIMLAVGIVAKDYENGAVIFFDPESGKELGQAKLDRKNVPNSLSWNADGTVLYASDADTVYKINSLTFESDEVYKVSESGKRISDIASTPDGSSAAILFADGTIFIAR
jgi:WD40 repeat protein